MIAPEVLRFASIFQPRCCIELAVQADRTTEHGRRLGLSDEQASEVVKAWVAWYQTTPYPLDHDRVRRMLTNRALGVEWKP
jgi:hypothetical protein